MITPRQRDKALEGCAVSGYVCWNIVAVILGFIFGAGVFFYMLCTPFVIGIILSILIIFGWFIQNLLILAKWYLQ